MGSKRTLAGLSLQSSPVLHMFRSSSGKLQRQLRKGEFAMFKHSPVFESDFVQVSRKGYSIDVHNSVQMVTVGVTFSSPSLPMPDIMLLARPAGGHEVSAGCDGDTKGRGLTSAKSKLELTRLLPLKFVKLAIFCHEKKQLCLKLATGRSFYLQLCPSEDEKEDVFAQWEDLVFLLRPPVEAYSGMQAELASDMMDLPVLEKEDKKSSEAVEVHGEGQQDQVSVWSLPMDIEVSEATSLAHVISEQVQPRAPGTFCIFADTEPVVTLAPAGPDQGAAPGAAVTPLGSRSMVTRGTDTSEGAGAGPSVSALPRRDNTGERGEGRRASKSQAEALRKRKKDDAPTRRPFHSGQKQEDMSLHRSQGTIRGYPLVTPREKGCTSLSSSQMGSKLSQNLRSLSKTIPGGAQ